MDNDTFARMASELSEITSATFRLQKFIAYGVADSLGPTQLGMLKGQLVCMQDYRECLSKRVNYEIENF
jgi:hypothetical protein